MQHVFFSILGLLVGWITYRICRDPASRREQFQNFDPASRRLSLTLALLVFSLFALAPTLSRFLR